MTKKISKKLKRSKKNKKSKKIDQLGSGLTITTDTSSLVDNDNYIIPNEPFPFLFTKPLTESKGTTLISVGTIRGLIDASIGNFNLVLLIDYNRRACAFNSLNLELIKKINDTIVDDPRKCRLQYFSIMYGYYLTNEDIDFLLSLIGNSVFTVEFLRAFIVLIKNKMKLPLRIIKEQFPTEILNIVMTIRSLKIKTILSDIKAPKVGTLEFTNLLDPYYTMSYPLDSPQAMEIMSTYNWTSDEYSSNRSTFNPERLPYYWENDETWEKISKLVQYDRINVLSMSIFDQGSFKEIGDQLTEMRETVGILDFSNVLDGLNLKVIRKGHLTRKMMVDSLLNGLKFLPGIMDSIVLQTTNSSIEVPTDQYIAKGIWHYFWREFKEFELIPMPSSI